MSLGANYNIGGFRNGPTEESYRKYFPGEDKQFNAERFVKCVDAYMAYQKAWDCGRRHEKTSFIAKAREAVDIFTNKDAGEQAKADAKQAFFKTVSKAAKKFTSYFFGGQTRGSEMMEKFRVAFENTYPDVKQPMQNAPRYRM